MIFQGTFNKHYFTVEKKLLQCNNLLVLLKDVLVFYKFILDSLEDLWRTLGADSSWPCLDHQFYDLMVSFISHFQKCNSRLQEALVAIHLLDVLCEMTSNNGQLEHLQALPGLLETAIGE